MEQYGTSELPDENNGPLVSGTFFQVLNADMKLFPGGVYACDPMIGESATGECVIVRYQGGIGLPGFYDFQRTLTNFLTAKIKTVIIDFGAVHTFSRSGMGVLFDFNAAIFGMGKKLYLYRMSKEIENKMLELKLHGFFHFLYSEDDILNIFPV